MTSNCHTCLIYKLCSVVYDVAHLYVAGVLDQLSECKFLWFIHLPVCITIRSTQQKDEFIFHFACVCSFFFCVHPAKFRSSTPCHRILHISFVVPFKTTDNIAAVPGLIDFSPG